MSIEFIHMLVKMAVLVVLFICFLIIVYVYEETIKEDKLREEQGLEEREYLGEKM